MKFNGLLVSEEGVLDLEDHSFATMIMKIGSDKTHQWMLHLGENSDEDQNICIILKCLPIDCFY